MGRNYYITSPVHDTSQHRRLQAARCITQAGIPVLLWGDEALAFAHCVPAMFDHQHLILPGQDLPSAIKALTDPQKNLALENYAEPFKVSDPEPYWYDYGLRRWRNVPLTERAYAFPRSVLLRGVPVNDPHKITPPDCVYLHPASFWSWNMNDLSLSNSLSPPLPPENADIRVPTRSAFLNMLVDHLFDPPDGKIEDKTDHVKLRTVLRTWFGFLCAYSTQGECRISESTGDLTPKAREILEELRPENRGYLESLITLENTSVPILKQRRNEFLAGQRQFTTERIHLRNSRPLQTRSFYSATSTFYLAPFASSLTPTSSVDPFVPPARVFPPNLERPTPTPNMVNSKPLANAVRNGFRFSLRRYHR